MKTKLTEMHTRCPILAVGCCWLFVILQISNFEAILYLGHFFIHPVYCGDYKHIDIIWRKLSNELARVK